MGKLGKTDCAVETFVDVSSAGAYARYDADLQLKRDLRVEHVQGGVILPLRTAYSPDGDIRHTGGVLDANGNFVGLSGSHRAGTDFRRLDAGYSLDAEPVVCNEKVIYGGILWRYYGHVLLETMSRLWYYVRHREEGLRVVFDVDDTAEGKFREFFDLLGIPYDERTFIKTPTRYAEVIVPELAFVYEEYWHRDWLLPYDFMASQVESAGVEKVYFTRTRLKERNPVYGERPVERLFARNGFRVFSPERLSLREQIALMKGCRCLAAIASSAPHDLLFAAAGTELICLNRSPVPNFSQQLVNQAKGLRAAYVDVWLNPLPVGHADGPWIVGLTEELRAFFEKRGLRFAGRIGRVRTSHLHQFLAAWLPSNRQASFSSDDVKACQRRVWEYTTWFGLPCDRPLARAVRKLVKILKGGGR